MQLTGVPVQLMKTGTFRNVDVPKSSSYLRLLEAIT